MSKADPAHPGASLGRRQPLRILRCAPPGLYLDAAPLGEVLLPRRYAPPGAQPGHFIDVFLHHDSEDRLVATTGVPRAEAGRFACLEVAATRAGLGAFLDWGLPKDLLLPLREQTRPLRRGEWVVVAVAIDPVSSRLIASARLERHLSPEPPRYEEGEEVDLLIAEETPLGYKAIVNHAHWGLLYRAELATPPGYGEQLRGFIRAVRPDGKIDLRLDPAGYARISPLSQQILEALAKAGGHLPYSDDSSPEEIRAAFSTSKKAFKQALGALYRQKRIRFIGGGIAALDAGGAP
jgi:hypothetical protein